MDTKNRSIYSENKCERLNYLFNINVYDKPPVNAIKLADIEKICLDRLELYKTLAEADKRHKTYSKPWFKAVKIDLEAKKFTHFLTLLSAEKPNGVSLKIWKRFQKDAREIDHIGHYLMSLVFCNDKLSILFFLNHEMEWFTFRYDLLSDINKHGFLIENGFHYEKMNIEEKKQFQEEMLQCFDISRASFFNSVFLKLRFSEVYNLVLMKRVFLHKGYAYFMEKDVTFALQCKLEGLWSQRLQIYNENLDEINDSRLKMFIKNLGPAAHQLYQKRYEIDGTLNIKNIDEHAEQYFPLCMQHVHDVLKKKSHLRHFSRKQYATFLKHAGMPYDDAMEFFETEFTKTVSDKDFVKLKYDYYFRHVYGQVGGKIEYNCDTCNDLFKEGPTLNDDNGCPFACFDKSHLYKKLEKNNLQIADIEDIMISKKEKKYQQACVKYYTAKHRDRYVLDFVEGPNHYYTTAVKKHNEERLILNSGENNDMFEDVEY